MVQDKDRPERRFTSKKRKVKPGDEAFDRLVEMGIASQSKPVSRRSGRGHKDHRHDGYGDYWQ